MKRRHRKMKNYLLCLISVLVVMVTVIYAQESDINLDIFGNSIVSTNNANFNVHFVSNNVTVNGTGTATVTDSTTAEINASGLSVKDDEFEAVFVVKNDSNGVAAEFDLSLTGTDTDVIQVTKTISKKQLAAGESATVTVNVLLLETVFENDLSTTFSGTIVAKPIENDSITNTSPDSVIATEESRFSTYTWSKIKQDIDNNKTDKYTVGDERTITINNKQYRVRLANTEVTSDCNGANFSETGCGFIVEFIDMPTTSAMLPSTETTTDLGYENSLARQYLTGTLYDSLPSDLKSVISTTKVVSGHNKNINSNYVTYDKLFLLSPTELGVYKYYDSTKDLTRTLDYYENSSSNHDLRIKYSNNKAQYYWTRTPQLNSETAFYHVNNDGRMAAQNFTTARGIAPAFRIKKENS